MCNNPTEMMSQQENKQRRYFTDLESDEDELVLPEKKSETPAEKLTRSQSLYQRKLKAREKRKETKINVVLQKTKEKSTVCSEEKVKEQKVKLSQSEQMQRGKEIAREKRGATERKTIDVVQFVQSTCEYSQNNTSIDDLIDQALQFDFQEGINDHRIGCICSLKELTERAARMITFITNAGKEKIGSLIYRDSSEAGLTYAICNDPDNGWRLCELVLSPTFQIPEIARNQFKIIFFERINKVVLCTFCAQQKTACCKKCLKNEHTSRGFSLRNIPSMVISAILSKCNKRHYLPTIKSPYSLGGIMIEIWVDGRTFQFRIHRSARIRLIEQDDNLTQEIHDAEVELTDDTLDSDISHETINMFTVLFLAPELPMIKTREKTTKNSKRQRSINLSVLIKQAEKEKKAISKQRKNERSTEDCKYGGNCTMRRCGFKHPEGHDWKKAKNALMPICF